MSEIKVDFEKFERQRRSLHNHIWWADQKSPQVEAIWGIINVLDAISDAYLMDGEPVVLAPTHQYPNDDTIQIMHEHIESRCVPLMKGRWDCSDFIEEKVNV